MTNPPAQPDAAPESGLPPARVRSLLRKLRDRDLRAERVEFTGGRVLVFDGCASLDQPVEALVRYRLRTPDGTVEALELHITPGGLLVQRRALGGELLGETPVRLEGNGQGNAIAPELKIRIDPDEADERATGHFLRRLVRAGFR